jgi:hypothetical protein
MIAHDSQQEKVELGNWEIEMREHSTGMYKQRNELIKVG